MNLTPWRKQHHVPVSGGSSNASPFFELKTQMNHLFDRYFHNDWPELSTDLFDEVERPLGNFMPSLDVTENDDHITITAEAPGMEPDDIDISISGNVLTLRGEKKEIEEQESDDHFHCERRFGSFSRSVELPATADLESIDAEQANGLLTIHVKKLAALHPKKIEVKPGGRKTLAGAAS